LNIGNQPTYFMALKDEAALVKMYAMVNVGQYQLVATGNTVLQCEENYLQLLAERGLTDKNVVGLETLSGKITDIRTAVLDGNSVYYLGVEGSAVMFVVPAKTYNEVVTYNIGDTVEIQYTKSGGVLNSVTSLKRVTSPVSSPTPTPTLAPQP